MDDQIVRVRIGATTLPENASWAVPQDARRPLACDAPPNRRGLSKNLKTPALSLTVDEQTGLLTVSDRAGSVLWQDKAAPSFKQDGTFSFSGAIPPGSHFYGLGDKPDSIDKFGKDYINWNADTYNFNATYKNVYRSLPFFIRKTNNIYTGYFIDNTWKATFDFGKTAAGTLTMGFDGGGIDYYVIAGDTPKEILRNYAKLTGTEALPPLWSLGWQQSKYSYISAKEAGDIANTYRRLKIPADVIWLDIGFQDKNYPFTVGSSYRPLDGFIKQMSDIDFKTILITDLHIAQDNSGTYPPYTEGHAKDFFVKNAQGSEYSGPVWPANPGPGLVGVNSVFPDFTRKPARDWWGTLYDQFYVRDGAAGFWVDMNEPSVFVPGGTMPDENIHGIEEPGFQTRSATHKEVHNVFGMQNSRGTFEGMLALKPDQRPFVTTRATYAGGQRYAVTWTGDNAASWEHVRIATNMIADLGLAGIHSAADIGGYAGVPSPALLTRWIQIGTFYPISRDHAEIGKPVGQEPWANGSQADVDSRIKFIRNRYALMPYIYGLAEEASRTGAPMMRRMFLEFPDATAPGSSPAVPIDIAAETQFMLGPSLLVAPSPVEQQQPTVSFGRPFEAESMTMTGSASVLTDQAGFTGDGFVTGFQASSARISASLAGIPASGQYALQLRYSNRPTGAGSTPSGTLSAIVDGTTTATISIPATSDANPWSAVSVPVTLAAGAHTLVIAGGSSNTGTVGIDSLAVTAKGAGYPAGPAVSATSVPYDVLLPPGQWYDYWSGNALPAPAKAATSSWTYRIASPSLYALPVFVRGGSIIPRVPAYAATAVQSTVDVAKTPELELMVYPGDNCSGTVYADDGNSFSYRKGAYYRRNFTCKQAGNKVTVNFGAVEGKYRPSWSKVIVVVPGSKPAAVTVPEGRAPTSVTLPIRRG